MSDTHTGSCFCGAVEIEVTGAPEAMGYCHCRSCRSWSAGPVNAFTLWQPAKVTVTKGAENIGGFAKTAASDRKFCTKCGGHIMTDHPTFGLVDVYAAAEGLPRGAGRVGNDASRVGTEGAVVTAAVAGLIVATAPCDHPASARRIIVMCRAIKTLHNFKPPATEEEIRASALQFVRKLSGFTRPSKANELAFNRAVEDVARVAHDLLDSLVTTAPPRDRDVEAAKAHARSAERFRDASRG